MIIGKVKGQLISKCLFCVFNFCQKRNENTSHISKNEFIRSFFGRTVAVGLKSSATAVELRPSIQHCMTMTGKIRYMPPPLITNKINGTSTQLAFACCLRAYHLLQFSAKCHRRAAVGQWVSLCVWSVVGWLIEIVYQLGILSLSCSQYSCLLYISPSPRD